MDRSDPQSCGLAHQRASANADANHTIALHGMQSGSDVKPRGSKGHSCTVQRHREIGLEDSRFGQYFSRVLGWRGSCGCTAGIHSLLHELDVLQEVEIERQKRPDSALFEVDGKVVWGESP